MDNERCFVCGSHINTQDNKQQTLLERQLSAVFVLRELLDVPLESLEKCFRLSSGKNPADWVIICGGECQSIVNNAKGAYQEMCRARQKLTACQKDIQDKIMLSSANSSFTTLHYRTEIRETVRDVVKKKTISEPDDFAAGDRMADQLLAIRLAMSSQPKTIPNLPVPLTVPKMEPESSTESSEELDHDDTWSDSDPISTASPSNTAIKGEPELPERTVITVHIKHRQHSQPRTTPRYSKMQKRSTKNEKCPDCDYFGPRLRRHTATVHSQGDLTFYCDLCDKIFDSQMRLHVHNRNCHKTKPTLTCPSCDYTTDHGGHLKRHILIRHAKSRVLTCEICQGEFNLPENLRIHQASNHNKCSVRDCGKVCESSCKLRDHQIKCHGKELDVFKCPECKLLYKSKRYLSNHIMGHHRKGNEDVYMCSQCDKECLTKERLRVHMKQQHKARMGETTKLKKQDADNLILGP